MNHYLLSTVLVFCAGLSVSAQTLPFKDTSLSAHERAVDLCSRLTLEEKAQLMLDESPAIPRLGIKKFFWWSEALHGAANMGNVTVFPEPIAMASSFNPTLLYKVFDAASTLHYYIRCLTLPARSSVLSITNVCIAALVKMRNSIVFPSGHRM